MIIVIGLIAVPVYTVYIYIIYIYIYIYIYNIYIMYIYIYIYIYKDKSLLSNYRPIALLSCGLVYQKLLNGKCITNYTIFANNTISSLIKIQVSKK